MRNLLQAEGGGRSKNINSTIYTHCASLLSDYTDDILLLYQEAPRATD